MATNPFSKTACYILAAAITLAVVLESPKTSEAQSVAQINPQSYLEAIHYLSQSRQITPQEANILRHYAQHTVQRVNETCSKSKPKSNACKESSQALIRLQAQLNKLVQDSIKAHI